MQALNLAAPVFFHAQTAPERLALVVDDRESSFGALSSAAERVAAWVGRYGTSAARPPRVGVLAARSFVTYAGILGAAWAGGTYVPLNPKQPTARLDSIVARAGLDALVVDGRGAEHLADLASASPLPVLAGPDVAMATERVTPWDALSGLDPAGEPA